MFVLGNLMFNVHHGSKSCYRLLIRQVLWHIGLGILDCY